MTIRQALLDVAKRPHPDTDVTAVVGFEPFNSIAR